MPIGQLNRYLFSAMKILLLHENSVLIENVLQSLRNVRLRMPIFPLIHTNSPHGFVQILILRGLSQHTTSNKGKTQLENTFSRLSGVIHVEHV